jgi:predicted dehydrogenase
MGEDLIRIAVIGAGHWGPNLIRNFHNQSVSEILWVVDTDPARLAQVRARFRDVAVDGEAEVALSDPRVDAVVIATPTSTHFELAKRALLAGKHVLVEKPITTDSREGDELSALAARLNAVIMVGHVFIYNAGVQRVPAPTQDLPLEA